MLLGLTLLHGVAQLAIARESRTVLALPQAALAPLAAESTSPPGAGDLKPGSEFKDCAQCPSMVVVPSGSFTMGAPSTEPGRVDNEGPQHVVTIAQPFAVGKYEVTFDEWDACVADRACARTDDSGFGRGRRPVINVSYENVKGYLGWLSDKTKKKYRLLSEAEWEYAARAGSDKSRFWGDSADSACQYANVFNQATRAKYKESDRTVFKCNDGYVETAPVGSFKPNKFGLYDTLGNVWEWVEDCWNASYTGAPADGTAWNTGDCSKHVLRGGGWYFGPSNVRLAKRLKNEPTKRGHDLGFRVARALP
jgi:formylglycine-generating enzyme required for sulfatase activity